MQSVQDTRKTDERRRFNTNEMQEQKKINKETTPKTGAQLICSLFLCVKDRRLFSRVVFRVLSIPCVRGVRELY